tara:strand:+ start:4004 stop:4189 length:186 start_codon:yes stop_codon:yes gene_type:complete
MLYAKWYKRHVKSVGSHAVRLDGGLRGEYKSNIYTAFFMLSDNLFYIVSLRTKRPENIHLF